jgi:DNA-binding IscR family transcriptional regulator
MLGGAAHKSQGLADDISPWSAHLRMPLENRARRLVQGNVVMLILSKSAEYALTILAHLGRYDDSSCWSSKEIQRKCHVPDEALRTILDSLVHQGLVRRDSSEPSSYTLGQPVSKIYITEVVEAVGERLPVGAHESAWRMNKPVQQLEQLVSQLLSCFSLSDLLDAEKEDILGTDEMQKMLEQPN